MPETVRVGHGAEITALPRSNWERELDQSCHETRIVQSSLFAFEL